MPNGEAGAAVAVAGVAPGAGDGGVVLLGVVSGGKRVVGKGSGRCFGFEDEEKMAAVTAEPAQAETAAIRASVVLDILELGISWICYKASMVAENERD